MTETNLQRRAETVRKYLQRRMTAKEACLELGCSQRTVKRYKVRLLENDPRDGRTSVALEKADK